MDVDTQFSARTTDADATSVDKIGTYGKKTAGFADGQLHWMDANGDAHPVADEDYADMAASDAVTNHESTFNHALLHVQNTDSALDFGGANQVTAVEARAHLDSTANPHGVTAAQAGAVASDGTIAMTGDLDVGGNNITNVGTVDGRDISADGTAQDNHIANVSNPHSVTAAQVGAYTTSEVDTLIDATLKPPEAYDPAGSGNFPTTYGGNAVQQGDTFRIITADTLGVGTIVNPEDLLIALVDTPGQTDANWMVAESNRDQATETVKGVAEIATQAEVDTGTDDSRIMTALKFASSSWRTLVDSLLPSSDQKDAMDAANSPTAANAFATIADLTGVTVLKIACCPFGAKSDGTSKFLIANGKSTDADDSSKDKTRQPIGVAGTLVTLVYKTKEATSSTVMKVHVNGVVEATVTLSNINANFGGVETISVSVVAGDYVEIEYDASDKPGECTMYFIEELS